MDTDDLPSEFDVVILGTGLTETIAAAAFSRIGLKVLHLDRNNYYGGSFANFNLQGIEEWKKKNEELEVKHQAKPQLTDDLKQLAGEGNTLHGLPCERAQAHRIKISFHVRDRTDDEKVAAQALKPQRSTSISPLDLSDFTITSKETSEEAKSEEAEGGCSTSETSEESSQAKGPNSEKSEAVKECERTPDSSNTETDKLDVEVGAENSRGNSEEKTATENINNTDSVKWTKDGLQEEWRKFCFDLSPRVLYCSGDLVELLIQSDVARYCEFRTVSRVLTLLNGSLQQVPCSRADVFSSKIVSLIEKRLMMKFLQFAADFESHPEEYSAFKDKPFVDFLKSKKLTANVQHFVQHAIAMVSDTDSTEKGLKNTQVFLHSLGRYGNTAFLFSLYGSGELPQAFSRLSAVFGGVYCLMLSASHLIADQENKCCGIVTTQGKKINCKYVVAEASYLPSSFVQYPYKRKTSRAIFITDKSICESKDQELSLLNFVCKDQEKDEPPVTVMELPPSACVCPKGLFVVHLIRECGSEDPEADFVEVKQRLFDDDSGTEKPKILWSTYFNQDDLSQAALMPEAMGNIFVTNGGGDGCIDMEKSSSEAKQIFQQVCPEEEFLPKPPNPEDIIYVDDEEATTECGPGEFDKSEKEDNDPEDETTKQHKETTSQEKECTDQKMETADESKETTDKNKETTDLEN